VGLLQQELAARVGISRHGKGGIDHQLVKPADFEILRDPLSDIAR
jgi:hypothetical protein